MTPAALVTADLVAITVLVFGLDFPRYRRRDMVVAILGLNVGVMAVATALSTAEVSAGVGLVPSACCRSSVSARQNLPRKTSPTTSPRWRK